MGEKEKKKKKQHHQNPNDKSISSSDLSFKLSSDVKGLRFGGQFIVKSFTIRRATSIELLHLLDFSSQDHFNNQEPNKSNHPLLFPSTTAFLPTNFTILAHHAWHTLTLGLGTKKSKVVLFVFESQHMKYEIDTKWPQVISLGEVNRKLIRGLTKCEMARFKFRKGCITFYIYAVRRVGGGSSGFSCASDLRMILESVVELKDFLDHTAMLALPTQRSINYSSPKVTNIAP